MIKEIVKIGSTGNRKHFRIVTLVEVESETVLLSHENVASLIGDDNYFFERGRNPEFPNTWFLHITPVKSRQ